MIQNRFILFTALLLVLLLPLAQLVWAGMNKAKSTENYTVPIYGYDPRDLLRGQYITFRYGWKAWPHVPDTLTERPETGKFYVDERDAELLSNVLLAPDPISAESRFIRYNVIDGAPVPNELMIMRVPYKQVLECLRAKGIEKPTGDAVVVCATGHHSLSLNR